jgi:hypothetical protein
MYWSHSALVRLRPAKRHAAVTPVLGVEVPNHDADGVPAAASSPSSNIT